MKTRSTPNGRNRPAVNQQRQRAVAYSRRFMTVSSNTLSAYGKSVFVVFFVMGLCVLTNPSPLPLVCSHAKKRILDAFPPHPLHHRRPLEHRPRHAGHRRPRLQLLPNTSAASSDGRGPCSESRGGRPMGPTPRSRIKEEAHHPRERIAQRTPWAPAERVRHLHCPRRALTSSPLPRIGEGGEGGARPPARQILGDGRLQALPRL